MRTADPFDVLVLGGGPAGCAAALELARSGLSVALVERCRAGQRVGDTLHPDAAPWLDRLGLWEPFEAVPRLEAPGIVSLWDSREPAETDFLFHPFGPGWHLDRGPFDAMLAEAARQAGATVLTSVTPRTCRVSRTGVWEIGVASAAGWAALRGRWMIDATGRAGWFVRRQGVRPMVRDRLVAVLAFLDPAGRPDPRLFLEAVPDGWWYTALLPDGRMVAAFLTDHDLLPRSPAALPAFWDQQRASTQLIARLVRVRPATAPLRVVAANSVWAGTVAGPGWFAAGDAAMTHDPLEGRGIHRALASGWEAARAVTAARSGVAAAAAYQAASESAQHTYWAERNRLYASVRFWPDAPFWQRRPFRL